MAFRRSRVVWANALAHTSNDVPSPLIKCVISEASVRSAARSQLHRQWEIFADLFPASPYFSGERPGALDFLAAVVSKWSGTRGHLTTARPKFLATLHAIEQHPDAATVFARR